MAAGKEKKKKGEKKGAKKAAERVPKKGRSVPSPTALVAKGAVTMSVVAEPPIGARSVLSAVGGPGPLVSGGGGQDFLCGGCGAVVLEKTDLGELAGVLYRCPSCGSHCEIPT